jgi:hypothetical protein
MIDVARICVSTTGLVGVSFHTIADGCGKESCDGVVRTSRCGDRVKDVDSIRQVSGAPIDFMPKFKTNLSGQGGLASFSCVSFPGSMV